MADPKSLLLRMDRISQWQMLTDEQAGVLIKALLRYAETGERLATTDGMVSMAFSFMADTVDYDQAQYRHICERNAENIRKRWQAKKAAEAAKEAVPSDTGVYERIPVDTTDTNTNTKSKSKSKSNIGTVPAEPKQRTAFRPPTVEEVRAYCQERKNRVDAQRFVDFYESKGWVVGRTKMKDWKAAVRTWEQRDGRGQTASSQQFSEQSFSADDLESLVNQF